MNTKGLVLDVHGAPHRALAFGVEVLLRLWILGVWLIFFNGFRTSYLVLGRPLKGVPSEPYFWLA